MIPLLAVMDFFGTWSHWLPMCLLAVMIAVIIHATLLMFAKGFKITELERYAESEIMQAISTALMAILLIGLVTGASDFARGIVGSSTVLCNGEARNIGASGNIFSNALDVARCRIQEKAVSVAAVQDAVTTSINSRAQFNYLNMQWSIFGVTIFKGDWDPNAFRETEMIRITNNLATVLLVGMNGISFLMLYIKNTMLSIFIPIGILLRSFQFTRGAGALFIALGIGLYFIFPILFVLLDPGYAKIDAPPDMGGSQQATKNLCYPTMSTAATLVSTNAATSSGTSLVFGRIRDQLALAYVGLILHPAIAFFLTLAFVRYLMVILGGDTYAMMRMVAKVI